MSLSVQSIAKLYRGHKVLKEVSFDVAPGEVLGIVGPNGAGKSTLLRIVSGILDADEGAVFWKGQALTIAQAAAWGYLPEERGLYPQMKVLDQLVHFACLKGMPAVTAKQKVFAMLSDWNMEHYIHVQAAELSKGNQQRIQFLASLLHDPELIILDEPFSGLDPVQADWLKQQVLTFKQQGKLVLYSSHRMDSVEALCDRIMVLHQGERVGYGTTQDLCQEQRESWQLVYRGGSDDWMKSWNVLKQEKGKGDEQQVLMAMQETDLARLLEVLKQHGVVLESIRRHRPTLHELFVRLTRPADAE